MNTPAIISALTDHVVSECTPIDTEAAYDSMLDDCYSLSSVGGPFSNMSASSVLKEVDPIAYRCGKVDYEDAEGWIEIGNDYYDKSHVESAVEEFVDGLKSELSEMEEELESLQSEDEPDTEEVLRLETDIQEKQGEIHLCESYSF